MSVPDLPSRRWALLFAVTRLAIVAVCAVSVLSGHQVGGTP